jgi:hypothetical protein
MKYERSLHRSDEAERIFIPDPALAAEARPNWSCMHMPMRDELQVVAARLSDQQSARDDVWAWIVATIKNPEFWMIVLFCLVGLWLTFLFIHRFPDFGEMVEPVVLFP